MRRSKLVGILNEKKNPSFLRCCYYTTLLIIITRKARAAPLFSTSKSNAVSKRSASLTLKKQKSLWCPRLCSTECVQTVGYKQSAEKIGGATCTRRSNWELSPHYSQHTQCRTECWSRTAKQCPEQHPQQEHLG